MERNGPHHDVTQLAGPDALNDEQIDADRGRDLPHFDEEHQNYAEPDRVDAILQQHRIQQRYGHHDHAEALDQAAEHGVEHKQRQEELQPGQFEVDQKLGDLLADAGITDGVGKHERGIDDEQDVAADPNRGFQRGHENVKIEFAADHSDHHGQQASDRRRLGRRDQARIDTSHRAADQEHKRQDVENGAQQFADRPGAAFDRRHARSQPGVHGDVGHEHEGQQEPGHDAGHEQLRHRRFGERAIDDHRDARRKQNPERPAGGQ